MRVPFVSLIRYAASTAVLPLLACGSKPHLPEFPNATHRVGVRTELYRGGPQQGRAAESELAAETYVRVIETAGSYSLIETESGDGGWVITSALQPLVMK
jgi:hypothetical protein